MHDDSTLKDIGVLNRINKRLASERLDTTTQFHVKARKLIPHKQSGIDCLDTWQDNMCDPAAMQGIVDALDLVTSTLPPTLFDTTGIRENARQAREAYHEGLYGQQIDVVNDAHDLLEWIEQYQKMFVDPQ